MISIYCRYITIRNLNLKSPLKVLFVITFVELHKKIKIPEPQDDTFSYETIQFQLNFHPKEDQDVIMWIRNIKAGYKKQYF